MNIWNIALNWLILYSGNGCISSSNYDRRENWRHVKSHGILGYSFPYLADLASME